MSPFGTRTDIAFCSFCATTSGIWVDPSGPREDNWTRHLGTYAALLLRQRWYQNDLEERIAGLVKLVKLWGTDNMIKTVIASQALCGTGQSQLTSQAPTGYDLPVCRSVDVTLKAKKLPGD
jgi:hypothetical protein